MALTMADEAQAKRTLQLCVLYDMQNSGSGRDPVKAVRTKEFAESLHKNNPELFEKFGVGGLFDGMDMMLSPILHADAYRKIGLGDIPLNAAGKFVSPLFRPDAYKKAGLDGLQVDAQGRIAAPVFQPAPVVGEPSVEVNPFVPITSPITERPVIEFTPLPPIAPPTVPASAPPVAAGKPVDLTVQQQQAYLKILGGDIGKDGLTGKSNEAFAAAMEKFAKDNGIDPKDTQKVNAALLKNVQESPTAKDHVAKMLQEIDGGKKISKDDAVALQWILKANNAEMPISLRKDGTMDGIVGRETKTATRVAASDLGIVPKPGNAVADFRQNADDFWKPVTFNPDLNDPKLPRLGGTDFGGLPLPENGGFRIGGREDVLGKRGVQSDIDLSGTFARVGAPPSLMVASELGMDAPAAATDEASRSKSVVRVDNGLKI